MRYITFEQALELFPFIKHIASKMPVVPQEIGFTDLTDSDFLSTKPYNKDNQTFFHPGQKEWTLYTVDSVGELSRVNMRMGRRIIYPARNLVASGYDDWPDDVDEPGESIGEAISRLSAASKQYVILHGVDERSFSTLIVAAVPAVPSIITLNLVSPELIKAIAAHPDLMKTLHWRNFERLLARVLEDFGYQIELLRGTKDGGVDIFALRGNREFGDHKYLLQAKRWSNSVGVEAVRELLFLHEYHRVSKSCLATTSRFTSGAWELANQYAWQLELKDFEGLKKWIYAASKS